MDVKVRNLVIPLIGAITLVAVACGVAIQMPIF
jgi:hypothetical protein